MEQETPEKGTTTTDVTSSLALPAMHSLVEIQKALAVPILPPTKRAARVKSIVEHEAQFVKQLIEVADQCRDLDDDESLELIFQITKSLFELCDVSILQVLLADAHFLDVIGLLECNPHTISKMSFREDLASSMKFKEVIPITDPQVIQAIHMNFRIDAIKDNVLSRTLADGCTIWLESLVNENNISILTYISNHEEYMVRLRELVANPETESTGLLLLQNIMRLIQITQPPSRGPHPRVPHVLKADYSGMNPVFGSLHHALFPTTLLPSFAAILTRQNEANRLLVVEMLHHLVMFQSGDLLRVYMADERGDLSEPFSLEWQPGQSLLLAILTCFYQAESTRSGIIDLLKHLFHVVPGRDDKFLHMIYHGNYMHWWLHLLNLPDQSGHLYELHAAVWEVLTMCISHHGYRIKYLLAKTPIAQHVTDALASGNKMRMIQAAEFLKACVLRNESYYSTLVTTSTIWESLFGIIAKATPKSPSAVVSAILDMIMTAEAHNCRLILEYIQSHAKLSVLETRFPGVVKCIKMKLSNGGETEEPTPHEDEERYWAQEEQSTMVVVVDEVDDDDVSVPPPLIPLEEREETGIVASPSNAVRKPKKVKNIFSAIQWNSPSKKQKVD
ncbi:hypothetical protein LEN26_014634 [Aphanomyces euteiches]|nr:hypothetical protein AeMF1_019892 [Aphanomyces euteiches]KAH9106128.1 hypothetical protein LEN26_014634 [Aphanomyces euteiches]